MRCNLFKAQTINFSAGNPTIPVRLDFLPARGRRRQRLILKRLHLYATVEITTPAATTISGEDFVDIFKLIKVYDAEGDRRYITGNEARMKMHVDMGSCAPPDSTDQAAATGPSLKEVKLIVNFELPSRARRGQDYGMPVEDLLNGGGIDITLGDVGDIRKTGAGALTIGANTQIRIFAECREEHDLRYPVRDVVRGYTFTAGTEFYVPVSNKLVREVFDYVQGVDGNVVQGDTQELTCEPYNLAGIRTEALRTAYLSENHDFLRQISVSSVIGGPVDQGQLVPLIFSGNGSKIPDMKLIGGSLLFRFSTSAARSFLTHYISPRSRAMTEAAAQRNGYAAVNAEIAVANKGGRGRSPAEWDAFSRFMPAKQVGKSRGAYSGDE
jgi:hypothetical protein